MNRFSRLSLLLATGSIAVTMGGLALAQTAPATGTPPSAQTPAVVPPAPAPATSATPAPPATTAGAPAAPAGATTTPPAGGTAAEPAPPGSDGQAAPDATGDQGTGDDQVSLGEIPDIQTVELSPDTAHKALDAYLLMKDKYKDADLENYENLQDFVDQNPQGKAFETDIKGYGFANVNDWNLAITTLVFTYTNVVDDQTEDIRQQIEDIKADTELAQDMKDRMIKSLTAMIPSDNNRKIVEDLMKDPAYKDKVKQLETEEE